MEIMNKNTVWHDILEHLKHAMVDMDVMSLYFRSHHIVERGNL